MRKEINHPQIIQGGMGVGVSSYLLAREVSKKGELGMVSATACDYSLIYRLQFGDKDGTVREVLKNFPNQELVKKVLEKYFIEGGIENLSKAKRLPLFSLKNLQPSFELLTLGAYAEVSLAKMGHNNPIGINLLTKLMFAVLPNLYGAMLAGVNYVIMGAGVPREVPGILENFSKMKTASISLPVSTFDNKTTSLDIELDPKSIVNNIQELTKPFFFPIVSSNVLAKSFCQKQRDQIDGIVIERHIAGGHNAPPRGRQIDEHNESIYTEKDEVDLGKIRELDVPFYLAGGFGHENKLKDALAEGATGIQVGTLFAFSNESGFTKEIKQNAYKLLNGNKTNIKTDAFASPTGFPFKVLNIEGSLAEDSVYRERERVCNAGYLRSVYLNEKGDYTLRCASEPVAAYLKKGGKEEETENRKCLCNALLSAAGFKYLGLNGKVEPYLITSGDDIGAVKELLKGNSEGYPASDVIDYLRGSK